MKKIFALIFTICVVAYAAVHLPDAQKKFLYPFPYRAEIEHHAKNYQVDKFLAVSVMKVESNFYEDAYSSSGAVGLMQLMPETATWIASCLNDDPPTFDDIQDCERNIKYGIWYLAELEDEFFGNDILALAAYNAGRGNVQHWIAENGWSKDFDDVDAIPYDETRNYVKRVLQCREKYAELYGLNFFGYRLVQINELRFVSLKFLY
jgi:soluble lytic murein transglycosylase